MSKWLNGFLVLIVCFTVNSCNSMQENELISIETDLSSRASWGDLKICIIYASMYGNTERLAENIKGYIQGKTELIVDMRNINRYDGNEYVFSVSDYDILILGTATYMGDMNEDWKYTLKDFLRTVKSKTKFAFFGLGCEIYGPANNQGIKNLELEVLNNNANARNIHTTLLMDDCYDDDEYSSQINKWVTELVKRF